MFSSVMVYLSGKGQPAAGHSLKRACQFVLIAAAALLVMACPNKKTASLISYDEAERGLRLAINVNEVAYNSWNTLYENLGLMHRTGKISEARWAAVNAVDGVIVLSEADLIEGIERAKKLLELWRQAKVSVLSAESQDEVTALRNRETTARLNFENSIEFLNVRSVRLRDAYAEALNITAAVNREGNSLPAEATSAIRSVIRMVDGEISRMKKSEMAGSQVEDRTSGGGQVLKQKTIPGDKTEAPADNSSLSETSAPSRVRSVRPEEKIPPVERP